MKFCLLVVGRLEIWRSEIQIMIFHFIFCFSFLSVSIPSSFCVHPSFFLQGFKDLSSEGEGSRFKTWTDGESGSVILGVENLKQEDEGAYKCILNNGGEDVEHEFSIYVTGERARGFALRPPFTCGKARMPMNVPLKNEDVAIFSDFLLAFEGR